MVSKKKNPSSKKTNYRINLQQMINTKHLFQNRKKKLFQQTRICYTMGDI